MRIEKINDNYYKSIEVVLHRLNIGFALFNLPAEIIMITAIIYQQDQQHNSKLTNSQESTHCESVQSFGDGLYPQDVHDNHDRSDHEIFVFYQSGPRLLRLN